MKSKWKNLIKRIGMVGAILALTLSACSSAAMPTQQFSRNDAEAPALAPLQEKSAGGAAPAAPLPMEGQTTVASDVSNQALERIVIKNANLSISVSDPSKSMVTISKMAEDMGGFVVSANVYKETLSSGARSTAGFDHRARAGGEIECRLGPDPLGEQANPDQ